MVSECVRLCGRAMGEAKELVQESQENGRDSLELSHDWNIRVSQKGLIIKRLV